MATPINRGFELVANTKRLQALFGRGGTLKKSLEKELREFLRVAGGDWEREMKEKQFGKYRDSSYQGKMQSRSGALRQSMRSRLTGSGMSSQETMFSTSPYAAIHEFGGKIKGRPRLAIPFSDTLTPSGAQVQRRFQTIKKGNKWVTTRDEPTFVGDNGIVFAQIGKKGTLKALKSLRTSVTIPPGRLGFARRWRTLSPNRTKQQREAVKRAIKGARIA